MRSKAIGLAVAASLVAAPALAVKPGDKLYIRSKDTKVLKTAVATGAAVATLQPGSEVEWQAVDEKNKQFHKVKANGKEGFVLQANLSPSKPQMEVSSDGKSTSMGALVSSGAATRALSEAGQVQAGKNPDLTTAGKQVVLLELINAQVTDKDVAEHAKKAGLNKAGGK